jgi:hypothetical protein
MEPDCDQCAQHDSVVQSRSALEIIPLPLGSDAYLLQQ